MFHRVAEMERGIGWSRGRAPSVKHGIVYSSLAAEHDMPIEWAVALYKEAL